MIILESRRIAIITPPHTASGNLHRSLCSSKYGGYWVVGTQDGVSYDQHSSKVAEDWRDYQTVVIVRHPVDRLHGLWQHHCFWMQEQHQSPIPWWLFVAQVLQDHEDLSWMYKRTICDILEETRIDRVLHYETLEEDVRSLLTDDSFVLSETNPKSLWDMSGILQNPELLHQIEYWAKEDMTRFSYKKKV